MTNTEKRIGWWIACNESRKLDYGDNRIARVGVTHSVTGKPECCNNGLHASERLVDALYYGNTNKIYRVEVWGDIHEQDDKLCGTHRRYIGYLDGETVLRKFARQQALINIEKIKPYCSEKDYRVIVTYLKTGRNRSAAWSA